MDDEPTEDPNEPDELATDIDQRRGWRRLPTRLSVRASMLLVLVAASWLGWLVHRANRQRDAVAAVKKAGGWVLYDWMFKDGNFDPNGRPGGPEWLSKLIGRDYFDSVVEVDVWSQPSDADMDAIAALDRTERLSFDPGRLTNAGLAKLDRMGRLKRMDAYGAGLRDLVLPHATLARLEKLDERVNGRMTDALVSQLSGKPILGINLAGSQVTDGGVAILVELCPRLERLSLSGTLVGDDGLKSLARLPRLKALFVSGTRATGGGLEAFRRARRDVTVYE